MWQPAAIMAVALAVIIFWIIRPTPLGVMSEEFNIAVAEFQLLAGSPDDETLDSIDQSFFSRLEDEIHSIGTENDIQFGLRSPQDTGFVVGADSKQRTLRAEQIAGNIHADVVIYGVVRQQDETVFITPEFFVNVNNFYEAEEMIGQYQVGSEIPVQLPLTPLKKQELNRRLAERAEALAMVIYGLLYYSERDYSNALAFFEKAIDLPGLDQGRDVPLVLAGSSLLKLKDPTKAETYCNEALSLNKDYSRAYLCLGGVHYQQALKNAQPDSYAGVDLELLQEAIEFYHRALTATDKPEGAEVFAKANLAIGQAYLVRGVVLNDKSIIQSAVISLHQVISSYGSGETTNPRVQDLAAHAYAHLGLILRLSSRGQEAIPYYEKAYNLTVIPERKYLYAGQVSKLYAALGDEQEAARWDELSKGKP